MNRVRDPHRDNDPRDTPMTSLRFVLAAVALGFGALSGCARTTVELPLETNYAADDIGAEAAFWDNLPYRTAVTNDEALHGLLLTVDGVDPTGGYSARVAEGVKRGWLPKGFSEPANLAMQRGRLAVALCVWAKINGGVTMRIVGPIPRYAVRELVYLNILPYSSTENMSFSGLEFTAALSKTQDYIDAEAAKSAPKAPPAAPATKADEPSVPSEPSVPARPVDSKPQ